MTKVGSLSDLLTFVHAYGARVLLIFAVVLAVWGTYEYFRLHRVTGGFRSTFLIMAALTPLQGLLGLGALAAGASPREGILHMVYGVFATLFLPGAYLYSRGSDSRREALVLAGASWIVAIAFFRGIATG
jgi:heme A synthase